jgi:hypothetical protein
LKLSISDIENTMLQPNSSHYKWKSMSNILWTYPGNKIIILRFGTSLKSQSFYWLKWKLVSISANQMLDQSQIWTIWLAEMRQVTILSQSDAWESRLIYISANQMLDQSQISTIWLAEMEASHHFSQSDAWELRLIYISVNQMLEIWDWSPISVLLSLALVSSFLHLFVPLSCTVMLLIKAGHIKQLWPTS